MNAERFANELPRLFDDYPHSEHPRDRRFAPIIEDVENLTRENNLALLNLAASCLEPEEAYVEIGVFHGASLIAAMLGNEDRRFVGIDSFEFRDASLEKVEANLARYGLGVPEILVGDAFELVRGGALGGLRVGVWYYDAAALVRCAARRAPDRRAVARIPGALLIVDDTDWERRRRARWTPTSPSSLARAGSSRSTARHAVPLSGGRGCRCSSGTA